MKVFVSVFLLTIVFFNHSYASTWVEVNQMTSSQSTNESIFQYSYSWPYQDTDEEISICKAGCLLAVFFEGGRIYNVNVADILTVNSTDNCYTMQCLWKKWTDKYGTGISTSEWKTSQSDSIKGCWSFLVFSFTSGNNTSGQGVRLPGATCMTPPPENVKCEINNLYDFNHGQLNGNEINASIVSQNATLSCNAKASVNAYLGYDDRVRLSGGESKIESIISINDTVVTSTNPVLIDASSGSNNISIKSELKSESSVVAGEYVGSNVIILEVN